MGGFTELMSSFLVQTLSGVIEVFIGVWLALVLDRRRRAEDAQLQDDDQLREFDRAVDTVLGSVVKNTAEAKRILRVLAQQKSPGLIHSGLEASVWYAVQGKFIALCRNVDERVIYSQFFDNVRRLQAFLEFRSSLLVSTTTAKLDHAEPELRTLEVGVDKQLAALAEDLRFCGVLLITDHGKPVHKRLMGIRQETGSVVASQPA
jgi:hypothetical protein